MVGPGSATVTRVSQGAVAKVKPQITVPQGARRASGKTGAKWERKSKRGEKCQDVLTFLNVCGPFREKLRCPQVPIAVWKDVSDILFSKYHYDFSPEQLREKMRCLKYAYGQAKDGKNDKGRTWEYFKELCFLFDEPLLPSQGRLFEILYIGFLIFLSFLYSFTIFSSVPVHSDHSGMNVETNQADGSALNVETSQTATLHDETHQSDRSILHVETTHQKQGIHNIWHC